GTPRHLAQDCGLLRLGRGARSGVRRAGGGLRARGQAPGELPRAPQRPAPGLPPSRRRLRRHLRGVRRAAHDAVAGCPAGQRREWGRRRTRPSRDPEVLQRRPAGRRQVQGLDPGGPEPPGDRQRPGQAPDRLRLRLDLRPRRRDAAHRRQGLHAHAAQRRDLRRGARVAHREGLLQPVL
ncbi:MAG: FIG021292: hypothetical protein, partial [uncultured Solirubrobacteraceae bacterium]